VSLGLGRVGLGRVTDFAKYCFISARVSRTICRTMSSSALSARCSDCLRSPSNRVPSLSLRTSLAACSSSTGTSVVVKNSYKLRKNCSTRHHKKTRVSQPRPARRPLSYKLPTHRVLAPLAALLSHPPGAHARPDQPEQAAEPGGRGTTRLGQRAREDGHGQRLERI